MTNITFKNNFSLTFGRIEKEELQTFSINSSDTSKIKSFLLDCIAKVDTSKINPSDYDIFEAIEDLETPDFYERIKRNESPYFTVYKV